MVLPLTWLSSRPTASKAYSRSSTVDVIPAVSPLPPAAPEVFEVMTSGEGVAAMWARCGCRRCGKAVGQEWGHLGGIQWVGVLVL